MSWLDKNFRYIRSDKQGEGYLAKRFRQVRAEQKAKEAAEAAAEKAQEELDAANALEAQQKTAVLPRIKAKVSA